MKIIFASFQGVSNDKPQGMVRLLLPVFDELNKQSSEHLHAYYIGSKTTDEPTSPAVLPLNPLFSKIKNLIAVIVNRLFFVKNKRGWARLLQEYVYDYFLASKIVAPTLLVSSCYSVRAFRKNRKLGGKNVLVAGNPDDREIFSLLELEKKKHGIEIEDPYTLNSRIAFINRSIELCDRVMYHTSSQLDSFSKTIPEAMSFYRDIVINPGYITIDKKPTTNTHLVFCYIAHTVWLKGLTYLLQAWRKHSGSDIELLIGGSIDPSVKRFIADNNLTYSNVRFLGPITDLNDFYRSADVCIVPSLIDAGPVTVAEALVGGMPVICSSGCGSKSLIQEENGVVVDPLNIAQMEEAIEYMINNFHKYEPDKIKNLFLMRTQGNPYKDFSSDIETFYRKIQLELGSK